MTSEAIDPNLPIPVDPPAVVITPPSIGKRVWYWPPTRQGAAQTKVTVLRAGVPLDATVVFVFDARLVNLSIRDHIGTLHARQSVRLVQPTDVPPAVGTEYAALIPNGTA